jgi:Exopolysaccharide biosynthesis protein
MDKILISLKQELGKIVELINKEDAFYFDYPMHLNVGDLLIYAGTEAFFKEYNINIRLRRCLQTFDINEVKKNITKNTTIICHGGGNLGDLYPLLQKLREELVINFPNNRIILLPQTGYFSNQDEMKKSAAIFSAHKDCHLFARDLPTLELLKNFSDKVILCPDMAHQLYGEFPLKNKVESLEKNKLYFLRKDIEASQLEKNIESTLSASAVVKDWDDIVTSNDIMYARIYSKLARISNISHLSIFKDKINDLWYKHTLNIIERARNEFMKYDLVVTSRLHGHIFSCLLGIPNQVCDNSYGKNLGYYNQWTKDIDYAEKYQGA